MEPRKALRKIPRQFEDLTFLKVSDLQEEPRIPGASSRPDLSMRADSHVFWVEYKSQSTAEAVGAALRQIESWWQEAKIDPWSALLVVPYMGGVGRRLCDGAGVNWMDLSGNASIRTPGLNVNVAGRPNQHARRGRPSNVFARKASRLSRAMLTEPDRRWLQQELVDVTRLSKGYVSKLLTRLGDAGFVEWIEAERGHGYQLLDRERLLSAWRESYSFKDQRIIRGSVAERTPEGVLRRLVGPLGRGARDVAITGLAAAWHYDRHAGFRLSSIYVSPLPDEASLSAVGFREVESGANVWLVEPADAGVFWGCVEEDGLSYVSPLQAYLDLKDHPERAEEAADSLRHRAWRRTP
jgi:hypothetical protein